MLSLNHRFGGPIFLSCYFLIFHPAHNPLTKEKNLFIIERSRDANQIFYDIHLTKEGKLDTNNPIEVYWVKWTDEGKKQPLTWIQRKYAYGLKFLNITQEEAEFQFVSYDKRNFKLKRGKKGDFVVCTLSQGREVFVERIFIQIDGGTFWVPKVSRVELHTRVKETGCKITEIIRS